MVNTPVVVTNEIVASTNDICFGEMVSFTALPENGGTNPVGTRVDWPLEK